MKKKFKNFLLLLKNISLLFIFYSILPVLPVCAAYPKLVYTLTEAFLKINSYLKTVGGPAAVTAIGTGIFIKKFSFGDEERIRVGKRLIKTAVFSYAFLLCTDLLIATIKTLLTQ